MKESYQPLAFFTERPQRGDILRNILAEREYLFIVLQAQDFDKNEVSLYLFPSHTSISVKAVNFADADIVAYNFVKVV